MFIEGDASLDERYGARVPVLRDPAAGRELDWPFDVAGVCRFLADAPDVPEVPDVPRPTTG